MSAQRPRRRAVLAIAGALVAVLCAAAIIAGFTGGTFINSDPEAREPRPSATPRPLKIDAPSDESSSGESDAVDSASTTLASVVDAGNQILQRADGITEGLDAVTTGFVQGELEALAAERKEQGFRQVGASRVVSTSVRSVDLDATPATIVLNACIDSSDVDVLDENGNSLKESLYNPGHPVLHVYSAVRIDGAWKMSTHDIPDDDNACL